MMPPPDFPASPVKSDSYPSSPAPVTFHCTIRTSERRRRRRRCHTSGRNRVTVDGNEAAASVAFRVSEAIAIYPITPSSPMAEHCDEWTRRGITNLWDVVPEMAEMQSEGGAAGAVHGALQAGRWRRPSPPRRVCS